MANLESLHPRSPTPQVVRSMAAALAGVLGRSIDPALLLQDLSPWVIPWRGDSFWDTGPEFVPPRPRMPRRSIGAAERRSLVTKFQATCLFCCRSGTKTKDDPDAKRWQTDHYIPKARGGSCHPSNIVLACYFCNYEKWDRLWLPGESMERLRAAG